MRITESQIRKIAREEILGESHAHGHPSAPAFLPDGWVENGELEYSFDDIPSVIVYWDAGSNAWILEDYRSKIPFETAEHAISYVLENQDDPRMSWNWS